MEIHVRLTIDDRIVNALRRIGTRRGAAVALGLVALCVSFAVFAAPVSKPHTFAAGDAILASDINENFDALYAELEARVVRADLTVDVADCGKLRGALATFDDRRIASSATVTFQLPEVTSNCFTPVIIDHPDGAHFRILGQGSDKTKLTFFGGNGFLIPMTRGVGLIDKMTISGNDTGGNGVMVQGSAGARLGNDFVIKDFIDGVHTAGGWISAAGVVSEDNANNGFEASSGGFIFANGAVARGNGNFGFDTYLASGILANGASAQNNGTVGFNSNFGSVIQATENASASGNQTGYAANGNSVLIAFDTTASANTLYGYAASKDSLVDIEDPVTNDNGTGFVAVDGSYINVARATGNSNTVQTPGANTFNQADRSLVKVVQ